jgi:hypothetical protein
MNLYKVLRHLVPEEIKALLEKIDTLERYDSSSYPIEHLRRNGKFTWLERKLLSNAVDRVQRRRTLSDAMHIVIYGDVEKSPDSASLYGTGTFIGGVTLTTSQSTYLEQMAGKLRKVAFYGQS